MVNKFKVWIGLVTLIPVEGNTDLGDANGAVVNVLNWSKGPKDFELKVREKLLEFGFIVEEIEDIEPFSFSPANHYKDNLLELANMVKQDKNLRWGTFYTYDT